MTSLSVSLPQTRKSAEQPKISASATAVPCLKAFPAEARARMTTSSPDPVQPTCSDPKPWARPDPDRWVRATWTNGSGALQVTSSVTSTAAPRETSLAGDWTWTSRKSPPEENATAGPDGANNANEAPASSVTVSTTAGRCQTKSKPPARTDGRHVRLGRRRHLAPLRLRAHSGGDASNPSDAMVPRWTLSVFGVDAPSTPSVRTGRNPPIAVVGSEFLGSGIRATVVAWTRAYPHAGGGGEQLDVGVRLPPPAFLTTARGIRLPARRGG